MCSPVIWSPAGSGGDKAVVAPSGFTSSVCLRQRDPLPLGGSVGWRGTNSGQLMSWEKSVWAGSPMASGGSGHLSGSSFRRIFRSMISTSLLSFRACDQRSRESLGFPQVHVQSYSSSRECFRLLKVIYRSTYRDINIHIKTPYLRLTASKSIKV